MIKKLAFIIIFLIIPAIAWADEGEGCYSMMDWYGGGGWGMAFIPLLWMLAVGAIIVFLIKNYGKTEQSSQEKSKSAIEILKERYAKGEITKEQFESMKKDIGG